MNLAFMVGIVVGGAFFGDNLSLFRILPLQPHVPKGVPCVISFG